MGEKKPRVAKKKKVTRKPRRKVKGSKTDLLGRKVPIETPAIAMNLAEQVAILRRIAATDYISDSEGRSMRWHYERKDRFYERTVAWSTFESWGEKDNWTRRRIEFWEEVESRVRIHMGDENYRYRVKHMDKLRTF